MRRWAAGVAVLMVAACSSGSKSSSSSSLVASPPPSSTAVSKPTTTTTTTAPAGPDVTVWVVMGTQGAYGQNVAQQLVPVDVTTGRVGNAVPVLLANGSLLAIDRQGKNAYEESSATGGESSAIDPFDLTTGRRGTPIPLPSSTAGTGTLVVTSAAFTPDGSTGYFVDAGNGVVVPVSFASGSAGTPITVGNLAACGDVETEAALTPDGQDLYIEGSGGLFDVDLTKGKSSAAFSVSASGAAGAYGNPSISLSPDGSTLYVLQSGTHADTLVPVVTNGDNAGTPITVPVGTKPPDTSPSGEQEPSWDKVYVPSNGTADVVEFGSVPEQIVPVSLPLGTAAAPVVISPTHGTSSCGNQAPVPVAIAAGGSVAVVGEGTSVHTVSLPGGAAGPAISVGGQGKVVGILSPDGWPDYWPS